ncbi:CAAD domain-containing protein [Acaryochloris sp. CCMEE 5410]|uniref:CAAD domain-containing protein n=1 Tax=Acaryochloris sp. CCMEE 5410 TaxID=310037 RepID=UPI0002484CBC|nr:CAAD domain-containing protein [Acaryochloris sp. CCMEE 5410]KAI9132321.1 CAAD domain-containing protein [Acaryochloris sp. CCMEE 5410]
MSTELETTATVAEVESAEEVTTDSLSRRLPSADPSVTEGVQGFGVKLHYYIDQVSRQAQEVFEIYQKPLIALGMALAGLLGLAIANGILNVLNAIPLVKPLLEITGLGYAGWFAWRYLRYAETRQELIQAYRRLKRRVIGDATVHLEAE